MTNEIRKLLDLFEDLGEEDITNYVCSYCKKPAHANYIEPMKSKMLKTQLCFTCLHWMEQKNTPGGIVINGQHYRIGPEDAAQKGCGGRLFIIKNLETKQTTVTTNLWHQGNIPEIFKPLFPDNAQFVTDTAYNKRTRH